MWPHGESHVGCHRQVLYRLGNYAESAEVYSNMDDDRVDPAELAVNRSAALCVSPGGAAKAVQVRPCHDGIATAPLMRLSALAQHPIGSEGRLCAHACVYAVSYHVAFHTSS